MELGVGRGHDAHATEYRQKSRENLMIEGGPDRVKKPKMRGLTLCSVTFRFGPQPLFFYNSHFLVLTSLNHPPTFRADLLRGLLRAVHDVTGTFRPFPLSQVSSLRTTELTTAWNKATTTLRCPTEGRDHP